MRAAWILPLLILALLIVPATAADYALTGYQEFNVFDVEKMYFNGVKDISFDQSEYDKAITLIHFKVPQDHTVSYTIYYGHGSSVSGSATNEWDISYWPAHTTTSTIVFDGQTKTYSYFDTNPEFDYYLSGYARSTASNQTGLIVYSAGYGSLDNDLAIFKPVSSLQTNLIYRVDMHSDTPFDADISYGSKGDVAASVSKDIFQVINEWVEFATAMGATILQVVSDSLYWLRFIFIENLGMVVTLYIAATMAFAARSCNGNPIKMGKTFIHDQRELFHFILGLWHTLVDLIASFRGIFRI